jgi:hypothetical protein
MILFNLIEIFSISLMVALAINSFKLASQDGMIFYKLYDFLDLLLIKKDWIKKPTIGCPTCMSSVWSLPILFIEPIYYPFVVICTSVIATYIYDKLFQNYE